MNRRYEHQLAERLQKRPMEQWGAAARPSAELKRGAPHNEGLTRPEKQCEERALRRLSSSAAAGADDAARGQHLPRHPSSAQRRSKAATTAASTTTTTTMAAAAAGARRPATRSRLGCLATNHVDASVKELRSVQSLSPVVKPRRVSTATQQTPAYSVATNAAASGERRIAAQTRVSAAGRCATCSNLDAGDTRDMHCASPPVASSSASYRASSRRRSAAGAEGGVVTDVIFCHSHVTPFPEIRSAIEAILQEQEEGRRRRAQLEARPAWEVSATCRQGQTGGEVSTEEPHTDAERVSVPQQQQPQLPQQQRDAKRVAASDSSDTSISRNPCDNSFNNTLRQLSRRQRSNSACGPTERHIRGGSTQEERQRRLEAARLARRNVENLVRHAECRASRPNTPPPPKTTKGIDIGGGSSSSSSRKNRRHDLSHDGPMVAHARIIQRTATPPPPPAHDGEGQLCEASTTTASRPPLPPSPVPVQPHLATPTLSPLRTGAVESDSDSGEDARSGRGVGHASACAELELPKNAWRSPLATQKEHRSRRSLDNGCASHEALPAPSPHSGADSGCGETVSAMASLGPSSSPDTAAAVAHRGPPLQIGQADAALQVSFGASPAGHHRSERRSVQHAASPVEAASPPPPAVVMSSRLSKSRTPRTRAASKSKFEVMITPRGLRLSAAVAAKAPLSARPTCKRVVYQRRGMWRCAARNRADAAGDAAAAGALVDAGAVADRGTPVVRGRSCESSGRGSKVGGRSRSASPLATAGASAIATARVRPQRRSNTQGGANTSADTALLSPTPQRMCGEAAVRCLPQRHLAGLAPPFPPPPAVTKVQHTPHTDAASEVRRRNAALFGVPRGAKPSEQPAAAEGGGDGADDVRSFAGEVRVKRKVARKGESEWAHAAVLALTACLAGGLVVFQGAGLGRGSAK